MAYPATRADSKQFPPASTATHPVNLGARTHQTPPNWLPLARLSPDMI